MNTAAGESYQERVRYYRRKAEQARGYKGRQKWGREDSQNENVAFDFDEALYNFKQSSGFDRMYKNAKRNAKKQARRHALDHLSFYRDDEQGYIGGVCAGISDKMRWNVTTVRVVTVVLGLVLTVPTLIAYIAGTVFLRKKELAFYGRDEHNFWKSASQSSQPGNKTSGRASAVNDADFTNEENI